MDKGKLAVMFLISYLFALVLFVKAPMVQTVKGGSIAMACLNSSLPAMDFQVKSSNDSSESKAAEDELQNEEPQDEEPPRRAVKKNNGKPKVLIYHTHATESYLPGSAGNYHTTKEVNTVRDVGNVLEDTLEEAGIGVVHDKTLHDNPSYNGSYARSYVTASKILKKYPSIICVIDLHRDAIGNRNKGRTVQVGKKRCSVYSYVIATNVPSYRKNKAFIQKMNRIGMEKYGGFSGKILERNYAYNQDLSEKYMLLEIGSNRNYISETRNTAGVFGKMLAEALK